MTASYAPQAWRLMVRHLLQCLVPRLYISPFKGEDRAMGMVVEIYLPKAETSLNTIDLMSLHTHPEMRGNQIGASSSTGDVTVN